MPCPARPIKTAFALVLGPALLFFVAELPIIKSFNTIQLMLCDSHCHLDWFSEPEKVLANAKKFGVGLVLSCSTNRDSILKNIAIAKKFQMVKCAIGLHPSDLLRMSTGQIGEGIALAKANIAFAVAVGEVGLDFKHAKAKEEKALQEKVFREFISLAVESEKPIVVHSRYADKKCLSILEEMGASKVHMHWFTNNAESAARAISLGYFISCGPAILSDANSAEVVCGIPLESLLLETDAPVAFDGMESEPSWIPRVCRKVAELNGISEDGVAEATTRNFKSLYGP